MMDRKYPNFKIFILAIFAIIISCHQNRAQGLNFRKADNIKSFDSLLKQAQNYTKLVFIYFYSETCEACNELSGKTFSNTDLSVSYNLSFINIKISIDNEFGISMLQNYSIQNIPAYFFADPAGNPVSKLYVGNNSPEMLKDIGMSVSSMFNEMLALKEEFYKNNSDLEIVKKYCFILSQLKYYDEAKSVSEIFFRKLNAFDYDMYEWQLIKTYYYDVTDPLMKKFLKELNKFETIYGKDEVTGYLSQVFDKNYDLSFKNEDTFLLENTLSLLDYFEYRNMSKHGITPTAAKGFFKIEYYRNVEDWMQFVKHLDAYLKEYRMPDDVLNDYILDIYFWVNDIYWSVKSNNWAGELYKKNKTFNSVTTYALTFLKLGNNKKAIKLCKKAEKMVKDESERKYLDEIMKLL